MFRRTYDDAKKLVAAGLAETLGLIVSHPAWHSRRQLAETPMCINHRTFPTIRISTEEQEQGTCQCRRSPTSSITLCQGLTNTTRSNVSLCLLLNGNGQRPTCCCWFKLLAGFVGMSAAVNMQRIYARKFPNMQGKDLPICQFADRIAGGLQLRVRKVLPQRLRKEAAAGSVKRKGYKLGESATKKVTRKQQDNEGRNVGSSKQATCFICNKDCTKYNYYTTFVLYAKNAGLLCANWIDPQRRGARYVEAASTSMLGIVVITDYDASPGPREESGSRQMQRFVHTYVIT
jgi:hypothetical protein